ncbi:cell division cycle 91 [Pyrrhoderma noxium]|uniref:Cell division cycle 91 n=1 Tax=Pyrrhoderma noxium TaxID=2282107 RepID=A0A286UGW8_9AGAM|nr:cell division cycle 91 [Pyrrhoderma noxium]
MSAVIPVAIGARFVLSLSSVGDSLKRDHLLSSSLTSFPRLQEGIYLHESNIDPYSGGAFYQSPLFLLLFSTIYPLNSYSARILWGICDIISAYLLIKIWRARTNTRRETRETMIAGAFILNPYIFLPSLALSTSAIENTLYLLAVSLACYKKRAPCLLTLAFLTHLSLPNALLLPPLVLLLHGTPVSSLASPKKSSIKYQTFMRCVAEYLVYTFVLGVACTISTGSTDWIVRTWGTSILLPDLRPNPGLWWYFFTEMFDHFRPFFLMVFSVHLLIYVAPISIKFQHDPLYAVTLLQGILATFKPYPTLADIGLFLSTTSLFPEVYQHLRHPIVTALLHLHASVLLPLFHSLWLTQGTGNANFFYASTLVFGLANGAALIDFVFAGLRLAFPVQKGSEITQE